MRIALRILCLVLGYLFGMIQTAYLYGKAKGIDIREHGSGNAGTTNTLRVLGKKAGLVVFVGDLAKMCIPCLVLGFVIDSFFPDLADMKYLLKLYMGFGGVIGHNFPFYLGFKGGKGIAATSGMILGFYWPFIPMGLITFFGTLVITHYVSLSSLVLMAGFMTMMLVVGINGLGAFSAIPDTVLLEMYIVTFAIVLMAYIRHLPNIKRLLEHNERKTYVFKKNKPEE